MSDMTEKQAQVYEALVSFQIYQGYSPNIEELCRMVGVASVSTVHSHLTALKKKGFVDWVPGQKRTLHLKARKS